MEGRHMKYSVLPPESVEEVFKNVQKHLPDALRSLEAFALLYSSMGTMFFEVGLLGGAFWLTNIRIGWKATAHVVFWDKDVREELLKSVIYTRSIVDDVFQLLRLQRLEAYIPVRKRTACQYAERLGFTMEGILRKFDKYDGDLVDIAIYSLLKEDI
jgi:hypothetical protein